MKQTIVIVVGPDMTGKTQIAQELARRTGIPYFKASSERMTFLTSGWGRSATFAVAQEQSRLMLQEDRERLEEIQKNQFWYDLLIADPRMIDFLKQTGQSVIMDRGFPCEFAYSRVMKRKSNTSAVFQIDQAYSKLGAKIVICVRKSYEGIVDDIDPKINSTILQELDREYRYFADKTRCQKLLLEVDNEDIEQELSAIRTGLGIG